MRISAQILIAALFAGTAGTQTTPVPATPNGPASQTVKQNPPQTQGASQAKNESGAGTVKKATDALKRAAGTVKKAATSPFAPKPKTEQAQTTAQSSAKTQPSSKPSAPAATGQKTTPPTQSKAAPAARKSTAVTQAQTKSNPPSKTQANLTAAKTKQTGPPAAKAPVKKTEPVQAKAAAKPITPAKPVATAKPATPPSVAKTNPEPKLPEAAAPVAQTTAPKLPSPGKRDPFLSPLAMAGMKGPGVNCSANKLRCLAVDQVILKGIVQMRGGNFAVIENEARRTLLLHENDALFNGSVVKITGDSVIFREESQDVLGRPVSKEVIKKVSAPAV